jgi:hypothetical protein
VEGNGSSVEGNGSSVEGNRSSVEENGSSVEGKFDSTESNFGRKERMPTRIVRNLKKFDVFRVPFLLKTESVPKFVQHCQIKIKKKIEIFLGVCLIEPVNSDYNRNSFISVRIFDGVFTVNRFADPVFRSLSVFGFGWVVAVSIVVVSIVAASIARNFIQLFSVQNGSRFGLLEKKCPLYRLV